MIRKLGLQSTIRPRGRPKLSNKVPDTFSASPFLLPEANQAKSWLKGVRNLKGGCLMACSCLVSPAKGLQRFFGIGNAIGIVLA